MEWLDWKKLVESGEGRDISLWVYSFMVGCKGNFYMLKVGFVFYGFESCKLFIVLYRIFEKGSSWEKCDVRGLNDRNILS